MWTQWGRGSGANWESNNGMYDICVYDRWPVENRCVAQELSAVLCDNLDGWDGSGWVRGRLKRKGI